MDWPGGSRQESAGAGLVRWKPHLLATKAWAPPEPRPEPMAWRAGRARPAPLER